MSEERLRDAYRGLIREPGPARDGCPSAESLEALVLRQGPETERMGTLDHVMSCAACRRELDLLRALEHTEPRAMPLARPLALAATVVLAIAAGLTWRAMRPPTDPLRGTEPLVQLVSPAEGPLLLDPGPVEFVWRSVDGARGYTLEMMDAEDRVTVRREVGDTTVVLEREALMEGGALRWRVRAHLPSGGESPSPWRRLTPAAP